MDFSAPLNAFVAGFPNFIIQLGVALGLFVASLIIYVIIIWYYARYMNNLDRVYDVHEGEED